MKTKCISLCITGIRTRILMQGKFAGAFVLATFCLLVYLLIGCAMPAHATTWVWEAENLSHVIGRADGDGWSCNVAQDSENFMCYGPYTTAISGYCYASFRMMIDVCNGYNDAVAQIQVYDDTAGQLIGYKEIYRNDFSANNVYQDFGITFGAQSGHSLQFRTYWRDRAYIKEDKVTVKTAAMPTIYYFDISAQPGTAAGYDYRQVAACIQGLVNRDAPRLFLQEMPYGVNWGDHNWLLRLGEMNGLCQNWPVTSISTMNDLIDTFSSYIEGLVVYDPDATNGVRSTSLAATTAAACENAIAVRKDTTAGSMYDWLVNTKGIPVLIDLTNRFTGSGTIWGTNVQSTGSKKCDAYIWAKVSYVDTGECDPTIVMYTLDEWGLKDGLTQYSQLANLDYAISKKAFCIDLSPWADEQPNDDPTQPLGTDYNTLRTILGALNSQTSQGEMIKFCGFPPYFQKYTDYVGGDHDAVSTEWELVRIISAYNAYMEADAYPNCLANASFYSGLQPVVDERDYVQNPPPTYQNMRDRGLINANGTIPNGNYVLLGMGDYDGATWTLYVLDDRYNNGTRGQRYLTWAIDPNISDRVPVVFDWMFRHKTAHDYFMAWDSGAGYIWPQQLYGARSPSGYGSGVSIWQKHCREKYRPWDYSISGWLLNGNSQLTTTDFTNYKSFSGDGIGVHNSANATYYTNGIATNRMRGDLQYPGSDSVMDYSSGINFGWYRTIQFYPSDIAAIENNYMYSGHNHKFLDAFTYYYLLRYYLSGNQQSSNYYRATWVSDTIPRVMQTNTTYTVTVSVRNDGWDTWSEASYYRLAHAFKTVGTEPTTTNYDANPRHYLTGGITVAPGQTVGFNFTITTPSTAGTYDLFYTMVRDGVTWFQSQNNLEHKKTVVVSSNPATLDTDGDGTTDATERTNGTLWWHPYSE